MLIAGAEVDGHTADVRVEGALVTEVGLGLRRRPGEPVLTAGGNALLPGLHDHHVHLLALAAARDSVRLGPPAVHDRRAFEAALAGADRELPAGAWLRGVGYHESVAGFLDRHILDRVVEGRPMRVQHATGSLWVLNSRALAAVSPLDAAGPGVERDDRGEPTGRLFGLDEWMRGRTGGGRPPLADVGAVLARLGVTGVTDATPTLDPAALELLAEAVAAGDLPQAVTVMGPPGLGSVAPVLRLGPAKIVLADHDLPTLPAVAATVRAARRHERAVAIHCVTRVALVLALAALEEVGSRPGDRIEHASVVPPELRATLARLGLTVVTQPNFVAERGDRYLGEVDPDDVPYLYPCRSLLEAGVPVGGGTDAPFGDPDPWRAVSAATTRRTDGGRVLGAGERVDARRALELFQTPASDPGGDVRRVRPGSPADLCLLRLPLAAALLEPSAELVAATVAGGHVVFSR